MVGGVLIKAPDASADKDGLPELDKFLFKGVK
jgi:hypothetical protein